MNSWMPTHIPSPWAIQRKYFTDQSLKIPSFGCCSTSSRCFASIRVDLRGCNWWSSHLNLVTHHLIKQWCQSSSHFHQCPATWPHYNTQDSSQLLRDEGGQTTQLTLCVLNSLARVIFPWNVRWLSNHNDLSNFQTNLSGCWLICLLWNCPHMNISHPDTFHHTVSLGDNELITSHKDCKCITSAWQRLSKWLTLTLPVNGFV